MCIRDRGILFAIFICDILNKRLKKLYQSAILFPFLMSMAIVGYIVYAFVSMQSGIVNKTILPLLGKEMCIRDRSGSDTEGLQRQALRRGPAEGDGSETGTAGRLAGNTGIN